MINMHNISIRPEEDRDIPAIAELLKETFETEVEADLVVKLREKGDYISLVALNQEQVVGHIFFSPAPIKEDDMLHESLVLAPLAVKPDFQNRGIGTQLTQKGIEVCKEQGHDILTVVGHSNYYPRFGFVIASKKEIYPPFPVPDEAFMVLEVVEGSLHNKKGIVQFPAEFKD